MKWENDTDLFDLVRKHLYTPVVGDILDNLGHRHQFLPQPIGAIAPGMRIAGRAMPVQIVDVAGPQASPFGRLTEALDQIAPGEIYVATGGSQNCAAFGEIMTAAAKARGGTGAVIDGFHRDTPRILEQEWPVFSRGSFAQDAGVRSVVTNFRCVVEIGGVSVAPGDLIFGDVDGVLVIPHTVEQDVITLALEKASGEKLVRKEIESGVSTTEAFRKYGIL